VVSGELAITANGARVAIANGAVIDVPLMAGIASGSKVLVSIRPEHLRFEVLPGARGMPGTVRAVMPLGAQVIYEVEIDRGVALKVSEPRDAQNVLRTSGDRVLVAPASADTCHVFPATEERRGEQR